MTKRSFFRQQLENYLAKLKIEADMVFDFGGRQLPVHTAGRLGHWKVQNYKIFDLPEYNLDQLIDFSEHGRADYVFCLEVFDYLLVPTVAFQNIANGLKPGGTAFFSSALVYPFHREAEVDSLRVTLTGIHRFAAQAGLQVTQVAPRWAASEHLIDYYKADGMKMLAGVKHDITGHIVQLQHL